MMLKRMALFALAFFMLGAALASGAGLFESYLSVSGFERATGIRGVKLIGLDLSKGAGGDLNFANLRDEIILTVQFLDRVYYSDMKRAYFRQDLQGVGEKGFIGSSLPTGPWNVVTFNKGSYCVVMTTCWDPSHFDQVMLNMNQMVVLARIIASRL